MELEIVASGWEFLEAPRLDDRGDLWFSDVTLGGVHRLRPDGTLDHFIEDRTWIGGIALNDDGALICSGKTGLVHFQPETGAVSPVFDRFEGASVAINDFCPSPGGGVVAGVIDAEAVAAARPPEGRPLLAIAADGTAHRLWDGIKVSNGLGFSPDGGRLYHSGSYEALWAYRVGADGSLAERTVLAPITDADGLAVDVEGGVWVARFDAGEVTRFMPDGSVAMHLPVPVKEVQSIGFGGADMRDVFIATGSDFVNPQNLAVKTGRIYRGRSPVPGLRLPRTRFRPRADTAPRN